MSFTISVMRSVRRLKGESRTMPGGVDEFSCAISRYVLVTDTCLYQYILYHYGNVLHSVPLGLQQGAADELRGSLIAGCQQCCKRGREDCDRLTFYGGVPAAVHEGSHSAHRPPPQPNISHIRLLAQPVHHHCVFCMYVLRVPCACVLRAHVGCG